LSSSSVFAKKIINVEVEVEVEVETIVLQL
jgi:hypothetical protein